MKEIQLTQGKVAIVDDEDFERLSRHKWCAAWCPATKSFRAMRASSRVNGNSKAIYMHREVVGAPPGTVVDHINHNTTDNRRSNLRICSKAENNRNVRKQIGRRSAFKGVHWHAKTKKWVANIRLDRKSHYLGLFDSEELAAEAYDIAARKLHGEFAFTNNTMDTKNDG